MLGWKSSAWWSAGDSSIYQPINRTWCLRCRRKQGSVWVCVRKRERLAFQNKRTSIFSVKMRGFFAASQWQLMSSSKKTENNFASAYQVNKRHSNASSPNVASRIQPLGDALDNLRLRCESNWFQFDERGRLVGACQTIRIEIKLEFWRENEMTLSTD